MFEVMSKDSDRVDIGKGNREFLLALRCRIVYLSRWLLALVYLYAPKRLLPATLRDVEYIKIIAFSFH